MEIERKQATAVIQLHDIARFVERNFDEDKLAIDIRAVADKLNNATPSYANEYTLIGKNK